jgi:hypothetical protein
MIFRSRRWLCGLVSWPYGVNVRRLGLDTDEIIREASESSVVKIDREELDTVLDTAEVIRAEDTALAGWIRILSLGGHVLVQEETPERELLVRKLASLDAAHELVDGRLADYERMWDGCGCTIDYHAPAKDNSR